jgi:integrase
MATVRKRTWKAGEETKTAWIADYFDQKADPGHPHGHRHIKTFKTQKVAKAWLNKAQHEVAEGTHTPESTSITVAEAADVWIQRGVLEELERSTMRQYRQHVDLHIKPSRIGAEKLARVTTPAVEAFRDDLLKKCSRPMARKVLASLKSILGEAQRRGLVAHNAAQPVRVGVKKREKRKLEAGRDFPSKEEINLIITSAEGRWRPFFITAVFTGMRSSEMRGLTWEAVDFERKVIHVHQRADRWNEMDKPKSEAGERKIPMTPMVLNALREWRLACPKAELGLVFPNGAGKIENHANIANRGFYALQIKAGIVDAAGGAKYGVHSLRHFFASWAIEQDFTAKRLQALLGHSSIQMTFDIYGGLFPDDEDDQAKFAAGELALTRLATRKA